MIKCNIMKVEEIARVLVKRRKELGISQAELAEICQVSIHTLSSIESGAGNPTIGSLLKITDVLGLTINLSVAARC